MTAQDDFMAKENPKVMFIGDVPVGYAWFDELREDFAKDGYEVLVIDSASPEVCAKMNSLVTREMRIDSLSVMVESNPTPRTGKGERKRNKSERWR